MSSSVKSTDSIGSSGEFWCEDSREPSPPRRRFIPRGIIGGELASSVCWFREDGGELGGSEAAEERRPDVEVRSTKDRRRLMAG